DALVLGFLAGEVMDSEKLRSGAHIGEIAEACRRLHAGRRFLKDFDMFELQPGYLEIVRERGFRLPARYEEFEPKIRELERAMRVRLEPPGPSNNDRVAHHSIRLAAHKRQTA